MTISESLGEALLVEKQVPGRKPIAQRKSEGRFILSNTYVIAPAGFAGIARSPEGDEAISS
jgi:hypothetical protein